MSDVRFSMTVAGVLIEQLVDGTWHATEPPSAYGCDTADEVVAVTGSPPARMSLSDAGYAFTGDTIEEMLLDLIMRTIAYRTTIAEVCGPPMGPIVNQPWCPFEDEHQDHVQCRECVR